MKTTMNRYPPWFNSSLISNLKLKNYYRRHWKSTNSEYYQEQFKRLRAMCKTDISLAYKTYLSRIQESIKNEPRQLFNFVRSKQGISRIPSNLIIDGRNVNDPQHIVQSFANMFLNKQTTSSIPVVCDLQSNRIPIILSHASEEDLIRTMARFADKNTAGDDGIPSFLLRDTRYVLAEPLLILINLAIDKSVFPDTWKRARLIPIHKKGDSSLIGNYRPISILSNFAKIFESVIYHQIINNVRPALSTYQHGFLPGRSTVTNLSLITQYIAEHLDMRGQVDVIYTDFSSAFDTVDHGILLKKLSCFGFTHSFITLMASYLTRRTNYVFYNGFSSDDFFSISGVPQGSNLGPLLFILFINDLLTDLSCPALAYADDLKIYSSISTHNDVALLQKDLDYIAAWCLENNLKLNISKCICVTYTRKSNPIFQNYTVDGTPLNRSDSFQDLGIWFDAHLSFSLHIDRLALATSKKLGFIMRTCRQFTDVDMIKSLYFAFVNSCLEYCSIIWSPYYLCHQLQLERIHRRFLKFLSFKLDGEYPIRGIDYITLLERHSMKSLRERRETQGFQFVWKLLHGMVDCNDLISSISFTVPRQNARFVSTFDIPPARSNTLFNAPLQRICRLANDHYDDIFFDHM